MKVDMSQSIGSYIKKKMDESKNGYPDHVIAVDGSQILDTFDVDKGVTSVFKKTLEQVKEEEPEAKLMTWDEWYSLHDSWLESNILTPARKVDENTFYHMLEVLPPILWRSNEADNSESFAISEMLMDDIASFYIRVGDDYFQVNRRKDISHEDLVKLCKSAL